MHFSIKQISEAKQYYNEKGYVILKNFFTSKKIINLKKQLIRGISKKQNEFFYFETIKNKKKVLRRIERISDYSKSMNNFLNSKKFNKFYKQYYFS